MKKILKVIAYLIGGIIALALLLVMTLPLWLGPIVRPTINTVVPKMTDTEFNIGHLYLNPYTGRFEMGEFLLGNPKGYDEPVAVSLSNLVFDAAMTTLCDKYVHIEEIAVEGVFVSYLSGGEHGVDNFKQIQYNLAGSKEKYEAAKEKAEKKSVLEEAKAEAEAEAADEAEDAVEDVSERKVVIDRLSIKNVKVKFGLITIPVPADIVLTDLGKESDGVTVAEVVERVWKEILKSAGAVGDGIKKLGSFLGDGASQGASAVGEGAKKASEAVGESTKRATEAVGESTKKATEAVGEGAKKATEAVKNFLNF